MFTIRPAEPADASAVMELAHRLEEGVAPWRDRAGVSAAVRSWVADHLGNLDHGTDAMFVATNDGSVVGFVTLAEKHHWSGALDAYIGELAVDADVEGRGVGRALVAAARGWARERGLKRVILQTGAANRRARAFYTALGFEEEDITLSCAV